MVRTYSPNFPGMLYLCLKHVHRSHEVNLRMELICARCGISFQRVHIQNRMTFPPLQHHKTSHLSTETQSLGTEKLNKKQ